MTQTRRNWLMIAALLALAGAQAVAAAAAFAPAPVDAALWPPLEAALGLGWALAALWLARRLWRKTATTAQALVLWSVFVWTQAARLALFARADYDRQRWPFVAALGVALLLWTAVLLAAGRWNTRKETPDDDHPPEN
jgi:hypothetical protein